MFATNDAHTQPVCLMSIYTRLPENAVPALAKESEKELCKVLRQMPVST